MAEYDKVRHSFIDRMTATWDHPFGCRTPEQQASRLFEYMQALNGFSVEQLDAGFIKLRDQSTRPFTRWPAIGVCIAACKATQVGGQARADQGIHNEKARFQYVDMHRHRIAGQYLERYPEIREAWCLKVYPITMVALEAADSGAQREWIIQNGGSKRGPEWIERAYLDKIARHQPGTLASQLALIELARLGEAPTPYVETELPLTPRSEGTGARVWSDFVPDLGAE